MNTPVLQGAEFTSLAPLRRDLKLFKGPANTDGMPTWTLHDPVRQRFFRLGWIEYHLLSFWPVGTIDGLIDALLGKANIQVTPQQIGKMVEFGTRHNLFQTYDRTAVQQLMDQHDAQQPGLWGWLLHHYLFFRIHIFCPDRFLQRTLPVFKTIFTPFFFTVGIIIALSGFYLTARQWDLFTRSFIDSFTLTSVYWYGLTILFAKLVHELGHGLTARYFGCHVPSMGIAFIVFWPIFYTDTSDAWKLTTRRARLAISSAGVVSELALAILATFLWSFFPQGPAQNSLVMLASVTWLVTLTINLNPLMRFDGYYIFSDLIGVANLQDRAFALARWHVRECLFGFKETVPEFFNKQTQRRLLIYAYGTWLYRLLIFVGIALLVYHLMFKLAGIILMLVELGWFVLLPIIREFRQWWLRRRNVQLNQNVLVSVLTIITLGIVTIVPWQKTVIAPALLKSELQSVVYAPVPARIEKVFITEKGQLVTKGDLLLQLSAPDLHQKIAQINLKIKMLRWQIDHTSGSLALLQHNQVLHEQLIAALTEQQGYLQSQSKLAVRAAFSGVISHIEPGLRPGRWVNPSTALLEFNDPTQITIEAYVTEADITDIVMGGTGVFLADDLAIAPITAAISRIDDIATPFFGQPHFAAIHGGRILTHSDGNGRQVPVNAVYRLIFNNLNPAIPRQQALLGVVQVIGTKQSLLARAWTLMATIIIRESGF